MDACERSGNNSETPKMPDFQSGMFARRSFTEVVVANNDPRQVLPFVIARRRWYGTCLAIEYIGDFVLSVILCVGGSNEEVV